MKVRARERENKKWYWRLEQVWNKQTEAKKEQGDAEQEEEEN